MTDWSIFRLFTSVMAATACVALGLIVLAKNRHRLISVNFMMCNVYLALWNISDVLIVFSSSRGFALFFDRLSYVWAIMVVPSFFSLCLHVAGESLTRRPLAKTLRFLALVLLACLPTSWVIKDVQISPRFTETPGVLFPLFVGYFVLWLGYGLFIVFDAYRRAGGIRKLQIKFLFASLLSALLAGMFYFANMLSDAIPPIFYLLELLYVFLTSYAILRYRALDTSLALRRGTVLFFYFTSMMTPLFTLLWLFQVSRPVQVLIIAVGVVAAPFAYMALQARLFQAIDRLRPFKGKYRHLQDIDALRKVIANASSPSEWSESLVAAISELIYAESLGIFLHEPATNFFRPVRFMGGDLSRVALHSPLQTSPLVRFLIQTESPVVREEVAYELPVEEADAVIKSMDAISARVCSPFFRGGGLLGFISLGRKLSPKKQGFSERDFDFKALRFALEFTSRGDKNQLIINDLILREMKSGLDDIPARTDLEIVSAMNAIVSNPSLGEKLDLVTLHINPNPGRLLRFYLDQKGAGKSSLSGEDMRILNTSILQALYTDELADDGTEELYNDEDIKVIWRLTQDAEQALLVIEANAHERMRAAEWAHDLQHPFAKGSFRLLGPLLDGTFGPITEAQKLALMTMQEDSDFLQKKLAMLLNPAEGVLNFSSIPLIELFSKAEARYRFTCEHGGIHLEVKLPADGLKVKCDPEIMSYRVLNNLLDNAVRYTPAGGSIKMGYTRNGEEVICHVQNTGGPVIPETLKPRIFERGTDRGKLAGGGSGLGLYNVARVIEAHGGRVWLESSKADGTTFYFVLPIAA